jgi:hypothetical protein
LRVASGDGGIVEKAEPHRAADRRVMARRAHEREGIVVCLFEYVINGGYRRARRDPGHLERFRAYYRIKINERSAPVAKISEVLYEANAVAARDLFVARRVRLYVLDARP